MVRTVMNEMRMSVASRHNNVNSVPYTVLYCTVLYSTEPYWSTEIGKTFSKPRQETTVSAKICSNTRCTKQQYIELLNIVQHLQRPKAHKLKIQ